MCKSFYLILLLTSVSLFFACSGNTPLQEKKVTIAYVNWAEGIAMTWLSKVLLEKQGYTVVLKNADVAPVFAAVAGGDADIFMDAWLPVTHKEYMDKFGKNLEVLSTNFDGARIGLVVPDYVQVNSIVQLNANAAAFDKKIVGIDAGAGIMSKTAAAIKAYQLKFNLQSSSEAAMLAILKKKIDARLPVVVTGWAPHSMFSTYKLKFLEDPLKVYGTSESIQTVANKKFVSNHPEVAEYFRKVKLNASQLGALMAALANAGNEQESVEKWIQDNKTLVDSWH